jgi:hypothetical protein
MDLKFFECDWFVKKIATQTKHLAKQVCQMEQQVNWCFGFTKLGVTFED